MSHAVAIVEMTPAEEAEGVRAHSRREEAAEKFSILLPG